YCIVELSIRRRMINPKDQQQQQQQKQSIGKKNNPYYI
ncbi:MAG: hypothetical protein ACI8RD_014096, partial [Bacillariaceae sp.]